METPNPEFRHLTIDITRTLEDVFWKVVKVPKRVVELPAKETAKGTAKEEDLLM